MYPDEAHNKPPEDPQSLSIVERVRSLLLMPTAVATLVACSPGMNESELDQAIQTSEHVESLEGVDVKSLEDLTTRITALLEQKQKVQLSVRLLENGLPTEYVIHVKDKTLWIIPETNISNKREEHKKLSEHDGIMHSDVFFNTDAAFSFNGTNFTVKHGMLSSDSNGVVNDSSIPNSLLN